MTKASVTGSSRSYWKRDSPPSQRPVSPDCKNSGVFPGKSAGTAYSISSCKTEHRLVTTFLSKLSAKRSLNSRDVERHGSCRKLRHSTVKHIEAMSFIAHGCSSRRGSVWIVRSVYLFQNTTTCLSIHPSLHTTILATLNDLFSPMHTALFPYF